MHYRDFRAACHWGDVVDGIGGANCRHSYAAWFPGMERTYKPNPKHPSGKDNAEVYRLTQQQRAGERAIRQTKRELRGSEIIYDKTKSSEALGDVSRAKIKLRNQQDAMRKLINDNPQVLQRSPRREWAGDMPKVKVPAASGRKLDDFLKGDAVSRSLKARGASKKAAKEAIAKEMAAREGNLKDFAALSASAQQDVFRKIIDKLDGTAKAKAGKHAEPFRRIQGEHAREHDLKVTNPNYSPSSSAWGRNCQRCVNAYEARRRGYDVTALPRKRRDDRLPYMTDPHGWPQIYKNPVLVRCSSGTGAETRHKVEAEMALYGDGARAIVRVQWKGKRSGHVFAAEQDDGVTRFIDPQNGSTDCAHYFESVKKDQTYLMRVDDKQFTELIQKCCKEVRS